jgi:hypothetical protein
MTIAETSSQLDITLSKKMPRKAWLMLILCVPVVLLAVYYSPLLVSFGWHVMHGMAVSYRGLRVRVPMGWTADLGSVKDEFPNNPQGVTLEKQPRTLDIEARGPETMYFNILLPDGRSTPTQQAAEWKSLFRQTHSASDFDTIARTGLTPDADCLEATPRAARTGATLACVSLEKGWLATYAGTQQNVPLFFDLLSGLKPVSH